jgi:hypothetical protein
MPKTNLTHKMETRTAHRWGTTNSKPPGPIIMMGQLETPTSSQIIFSIFFSGGAQHCWAFYQAPQIVQLGKAKTIFVTQTSIF